MSKCKLKDDRGIIYELIVTDTDWMWNAINNTTGMPDWTPLLNSETMLYNYSPAHGEPGYYLTQELAKKIHGSYELPDIPDEQSDKMVIY